MSGRREPLATCTRLRSCRRSHDQGRRVQEGARTRARPGVVSARAFGPAGPEGKHRAGSGSGRCVLRVRASSLGAAWIRSSSDGNGGGIPCFCGVLGLGRALVVDDRQALAELRFHASDSRWRLREAVAMALQLWGKVDFEALASEMGEWARGSPLERRGAAAALCEPALLTTPERVREVLPVLSEATAGIAQAGAEERRSAEFRALRKGLATAGALQWRRH
jgi:hypothetical protein